MAALPVLNSIALITRRGSPMSTVCLASAREFEGFSLNLPRTAEYR